MKICSALILCLLVISAHAGEPHRRDCSGLLDRRGLRMSLDFEASDLEGLYLELVSDVINYSQVEVKKQPKYLEQFLLKKASFLNDAMGIVRVLRQKKKNHLSYPLTLNHIYQMVQSLDGNLKAFGKHAKAKRDSVGTSSNQDRQGFVGYIQPDKMVGHDLRPALSRSIGLGPYEVTEAAGPLRNVGQLEFDISPDKSEVYIYDHFSQSIHTVDAKLLSLSRLNTRLKSSILEYDQEQKAWIVAFIRNPETVITAGFDLSALKADSYDMQPSIQMGFGLPKSQAPRPNVKEENSESLPMGFAPTVVGADATKSKSLR